MLDGRDFDDKCFVEGIEYQEGRGVYTKYGKCKGLYSCAKDDMMAALSCCIHDDSNKISTIEEFLDALHSHGFEREYPYRLCTQGDGGRITEMHMVTSDDLGIDL